MPPSVGGYSHGLLIQDHRRTLFISGQVPEGPEGRIPHGFEAQCRQAWRNVQSVLESAGMGLGEVVKVTTFLADRKYAEINGRVRREFLHGDVRIALTVVTVGLLDSQWLVEIEAIAAC